MDEKLKEGDIVYICPFGHGNVSKEPFVCGGPHLPTKEGWEEYWPIKSVKAIVDKVPNGS